MYVFHYEYSSKNDCISRWKSKTNGNGEKNPLKIHQQNAFNTKSGMQIWEEKTAWHIEIQYKYGKTTAGETQQIRSTLIKWTISLQAADICCMFDTFSFVVFIINSKYFGFIANWKWIEFMLNFVFFFIFQSLLYFHELGCVWLVFGVLPVGFSAATTSNSSCLL